MNTTSSDAKAVVANSNFTHSASKQLALYAVYGIAAIALLLYLLSLAAGSAAGSGSTGLAIDAENNRCWAFCRRDRSSKLEGCSDCGK